MKLRQRTAGAISEAAKTSNSKVKFKKKIKSTIKQINILNLILDLLLGTAHHKICK